MPIEIQTATKAGGGRDFLKTTKLDKMLKPGDVVDLAVVKEDKSVSATTLGVAPRRRLTTETIVEGVEVFSVSDASRFSQETGAAERASTVCVQLSQEQLKAALKAAEQGRVKIIPRAEQAEFETGSSDAPLAFDGSLNDGGAFEPPMNAEFSFSGLTEEAPASDFEIAVDDETADEANVDENAGAAKTNSPSDESVPFEIAVEDEEPSVATETAPTAETNSPSDALVPFEIAVENETPDAVEETEDELEKETPFRLRNASVRSESDDEAKDEEDGDETPNDAAAPVAPTTEPRHAGVQAPSYRESVVETRVADEVNVESAPSTAKNFKYISPFVTVNKKKASTPVAPSGRLGAIAR